MSEQGCTGALVFGVAFVVGAPVIMLCVMALGPAGGGDPFSPLAGVGLVVGVFGGLLTAGITTALALWYMSRR